MKNLNTIVCIGVALLCLFGCSKKSATTPTSKAVIVGQWTEDSVRIVTYTNGKITNTYRESTPDNSYMKFNSDGTGIDYIPAYQSYPAVKVQITYGLSASKLSLNYPAYQADGSPFDARTDVWNVLTLNDHTLGIEFIDGDGISNSINQYFYYSR